MYGLILEYETIVTNHLRKTSKYRGARIQTQILAKSTTF